MKRIMATLAVLFALTLGIVPSNAAGAASLHTYAGWQTALSAPAAAATTVTVTRAPGTVGRGYTASVTVKTKANATCSIAVYYKSGRSTAAGLTTKKANSSGVASWSWKVGTRTTPGSWPVYITCGSASATTYVKVR